MTVHSMELVGAAWTAPVVGEYRALVGLAMTLLRFTCKAKKEEPFLAAQFGEGLKEHRRSTGFFLPKVI
jgi:protein-S-isoprenylcysteine O-methyltransferase Ste14